MKIYDLLWKKVNKKEGGKARWEKVGILIDRNGKLSLKIDLIPAGKNWDGWLVVKERVEQVEE